MEDSLRKLQLRYKVFFKESKKVLQKILLLTVLVMVVLPFWISFQDLLTRLVMGVGWYKNLQNVVVPYELRIIGMLLSLLGFPVRVANTYIGWTKASGGNEVIYLAWNCVGWQTLLLFGVTLISGLSGRHTLVSKLETLAIGILGTYLVNILRLILVVVVYFIVGRPFGIVFHDYFSNLFTLGWLFCFWWFSYAFILDERR